MLACYKLKQEIRELEDYIARLKRHLELHTRRLNYFKNHSPSENRLIYAARLDRFVREVTHELEIYRRSVARLKEQVATLAA